MSSPVTTLPSSPKAVRKMTGSPRSFAAAHTPKPLPSASEMSTSSRSKLSSHKSSRARRSPGADAAEKPSSARKAVSERTMELSSSTSRILCIAAPPSKSFS